MNNKIRENIKIINKHVKKIKENEYLNEEEFNKMDKDNLLIYIKFLKGCKNVKNELLFKNVYGIIVDTILNISTENGNDMKIIVNNFYKNVKKYKLCIKEINDIINSNYIIRNNYNNITNEILYYFY